MKEISYETAALIQEFMIHKLEIFPEDMPHGDKGYFAGALISSYFKVV